MKALGERQAYFQKENVAEAEALHFVFKPTNFSKEAQKMLRKKKNVCTKA